MSYNQDLENAVRRIFVEAFPTGVENEDAPPNELDVDKIKGNPLVEVYEPTDSISDEQWKKIRHSYMLTFTFMQNINENVVNKYLDYLWDNWNRGGYKCSEDFINKVDELFENLRQVVAKRNKMSFLDDALYDELFEGYQNVINQMTWDDSITDKLLKDKAIEHQADIKVYLKKRVDHNIKLTDKMKNFKGVEDLIRERTVEIVQQMEDEATASVTAPEDFTGGLPIDRPPVEPIKDLGDNALYIIADDLDQEFEAGKLTEEFKWCDMNRMNYFRWASLKYTYQNGKTFTAEGLQNTLNAGRSRAKLDSKNP